MQTPQHFRETPAGLTANEILSSVKRGGMNKWKPTDQRKPHIKTKGERREAIMARILVEIGNKRLTVDEIHEMMNKGQRAKLAQITVRSYLTKLLERGLIQRTGNPHIYFK